jgi:hypothetical protein
MATKTIRNILRPCDLKARGIATNYAQLRVLIDQHGFPPGQMMSPQGRFWFEDEVASWLNSRPAYDDTTRPPLRGGAAKRAGRTVDPRQIDLEEAIAAKAALVDDLSSSGGQHDEKGMVAEG